MAFESISTLVPTTYPDKNYWFIRTDGGEYYETYLHNNFIAIGWDYLTPGDLNNINDEKEEKLRRRIAVQHKLDLSQIGDKQKATDILNKNIRFNDLKKGDVIIIPAYKSDRLTFGEVQSNSMFVNTESAHDCPYLKRRKIKWTYSEAIHRLDPIFYQVKKTRHAISDVNKFSSYIDREMGNLFFKDDFAHFILELNIEKDIQLSQLNDLTNLITEIGAKANQHFGFNENLDDSFIKLNLQSPGLIDIKQFGKKSLVIVALAFAAACGPGDLNDPDAIVLPQELPVADSADMVSFVTLNSDTIQQIRESIDSLEIDKGRIDSLFDYYVYGL